eukprot:m51a1_g7366 hypothetical protein (172) ;mRNA; f:59289-60033
MTDKWITSLCGCCDDTTSCVCAALCPCVQYGWNVEATDAGPLCGPDATASGLHCCTYALVAGLTGCGCLLVASHRQMVRDKYGIAGGLCGDVLSSMCCGCCVLAQIAREAEARRKVEDMAAHAPDAAAAADAAGAAGVPMDPCPSVPARGDVIPNPYYNAMAQGTPPQPPG